MSECLGTLRPGLFRLDLSDRDVGWTRPPRLGLPLGGWILVPLRVGFSGKEERQDEHLVRGPTVRRTSTALLT